MNIEKIILLLASFLSLLSVIIKLPKFDIMSKISLLTSIVFAALYYYKFKNNNK